MKNAQSAKPRFPSASLGTITYARYMSFVFSPTPEPNPTPDKAVKEVLETSLDIMAVLAASVVCIVALLAAAQVIGFCCDAGDANTD